MNDVLVAPTEKRRGRPPVHGHTSGKYPHWSKEYHVWHNMKSRCYNPNVDRYPQYGGRGIKVCKRWLESFQNFLDDMGFAPSAEHSLDRINVDHDYKPSNCRWATKLEQANNTQRTNGSHHDPDPF